MDASAILEYLLRTERAGSIESFVRLPDVDLQIPALCDVEVSAGLRRAMARSVLSEVRAAQAIDHYLDLPLTRHGHQILLRRILGLRENFSAYDAAYVALAEQIGGELLTADDRLANAARAHTSIGILP